MHGTGGAPSKALRPQEPPVLSCSVTSVVSVLCEPVDCVAQQLLCQWDSTGKNTGMGCHALLQGTFPTQGWNSSLLHCRRILYPLNHLGSPGTSRVPTFPVEGEANQG